VSNFNYRPSFNYCSYGAQEGIRKKGEWKIRKQRYTIKKDEKARQKIIERRKKLQKLV